MQKRHRSAPQRATVRLVLSAAISLVFTAHVLAQAPLRIPSEASVQLAEIGQVLHDGQRMEREERWGEALSHYEKAIRRFPERPEIKQRLTFSRVHYDLARRYTDPSFLNAISTLKERQALELYSEIAVKINSHYVHAPDWMALIRRGTYYLEVALSEDDFRKQHLTHVNPQQIETFRRDLHFALNRHLMRSRHDALAAVQVASRMGWQQLKLPPAATIMEYNCGAVSALDEFSTYLTGSQLDEVYSQIEGNFVGLGIELKSNDGALLIVNVIDGGPAHRSGIRDGDRIIEVDGRLTRDVSTDQAADMLKGEMGSIADLKVVRADGYAQRVRIRRERVEVPSVEDVKLVDPGAGIAYVRLTSFQKTTSRDVDAALWDLHRQGMKSLIIDLRGNPGGLLTEAVEIVDKFVTQGTIVATRGRSPREDFDYKAHRVGTWQVPMVVLIDGESASASEIFAGAIRDHRRGTVVGERSYGKGSVQGIFPLSVADAGVRLTTAKFYSPSGHPISQHGVEPNVVVRTAAKPLDDGQLTPRKNPPDAILAAGIAAARDQLANR